MNTKHFIFSILIGFCLFGCDIFPSGKEYCANDGLVYNVPYTDHTLNFAKNKSILIENKTAVSYKNNGVYFFDIEKISHNKYALSFIVYDDSVVDDTWEYDYTLEDIAPNTTVVKKGAGKTKDFFYNWYRYMIDLTYYRKKSDNQYNSQGNVYCLFLNGGSKKVFFATQLDYNKYEKKPKWDELPNKDGVCYKYHPLKDKFLKDTDITLESDKATSNHKVVTHVTLGGKRIDLATLPIKKRIIAKHLRLVRTEDF